MYPPPQIPQARPQGPTETFEFPKMLHKPGYQTLVVQDKSAEAEARRKGWGDTPDPPEGSEHWHAMKAREAEVPAPAASREAPAAGKKSRSKKHQAAG